MKTSAETSVFFAPKRMISFSEKRSDIAPITIVEGRNARPTSSGS